MSRTTKTRSTRRYYSPSSSPLRDSNRHYFPSSSPMTSLSPVRYEYIYIDTTPHRPRYVIGKVGKGGKGEECFTSSSSPSPRLRRNRSVSLLRTESRPSYHEEYGQVYSRADSQEPKKEIKTSISYTTPTPRASNPKIRHTYTCREDIPYFRYRTSGSGNGKDWYGLYGARGRSRSRGKEGWVRRGCMECIRCGDGDWDRDRDGRCEECSRSTYRITSPSPSSPPILSPTTKTTRVHIKNLTDVEIENRNANYIPQHAGKKETGVRVSVEREGEARCGEDERLRGRSRARSCSRGRERGRGERESEREGWRCVRNRTPTPYYEGFVRCWCRDGGRCQCRRGERNVRSCERGRKSASDLEYNYISPNSIPIRDAVSRSRLSGRERERERQRGEKRGRAPEIKSEGIVEYIDLDRDRDRNFDLDQSQDKSKWKNSDIHIIYHQRGRSQNFSSRNRNRGPRRSRSRSRSRSKSKSRKEETEEEERGNTEERTRYITRTIDVPRDGSLSRLKSMSRARLRGRDEDRSTSTSKRKRIYYLSHVSHVARDDGGRNKSTSRGKFKRRDRSSSTSTSTSDYTSEEIEREVRTKRKYSINGGVRGEARDQGRVGGGEARGERGSGGGKAREKGRGVRFMI